MSIAVSPLEIFRAKGVPHRRLEEWKYSDLRGVLDAETIGHAAQLVPILSVPNGIEQTAFDGGKLPGWAGKWRDAGADLAVMEAAAWTFGGAGVALRVPRGMQIAEPLRLEFTGEGHGCVLFLVEAGASLAVIEKHRADTKKMRNIAVGIMLEDGACLTHIREAPFAADLVTVETLSVVQEKNSIYCARLLNGGAKLSRTEFHIVLRGGHAEADLSGVNVLGGNAHADVTTRIDHSATDTTSRQLFKSVAGGHSRAVYQGKIIVREGAVRSDSRQTAKALLLTTHAEADLKPELEILADDVKCAHGAAVGDLDADALFYLRARGISETEARMLLTEAFLNEVIDSFEGEDIRAGAARFVREGMAQAMQNEP